MIVITFLKRYYIDKLYVQPQKRLKKQKSIFRYANYTGKGICISMGGLMMV